MKRLSKIIAIVVKVLAAQQQEAGAIQTENNNDVHTENGQPIITG